MVRGRPKSKVLIDPMLIRPLSEEFKTNGYQYKLLKRVGNIAIVKVQGSDIYEVHVIRVNPILDYWSKNKNNHPVQPYQFTHAEYYCSNSMFGRYGWCYRTLPDAEHKLNLLLSVKT